MMNKARGPVWHRKQKEKGILPKGLRGVDKEATWCKSKADHWVYGHGSFCMTTHDIPFVGCFQWMRNCGNEAKRFWSETGFLRGILENVCMDSKADDQDLYREFQKQRQMQLVTYPNSRNNKTEQRREMIRTMKRKTYKRLYRERSQTVEPMQGLIKDLFDLDVCWMRGDDNNRWLFAAMGIAVQVAQLKAAKEGRSTWDIQREVVGV